MFSQIGLFTQMIYILIHLLRSNVRIIQENYFDVGVEQKLYTLFIPKSKLVNYGDKLIKVYGAKLWNSIPEHIQDKCTVQTFKMHLKAYLINDYVN